MLKKRQLINILETKKLVLVVDDLLRKLGMVFKLRLGDFFVCLFVVVVCFFCSLRKKRMSDNTYGFANLRIRRIGNKFGKHILTDTLFINLYDYWTEFHNPQKRHLFWHSYIMWELELNIRRKWLKDLSEHYF